MVGGFRGGGRQDSRLPLFSYMTRYQICVSPQGLVLKGSEDQGCTLPEHMTRRLTPSRGVGLGGSGFIEGG